MKIKECMCNEPISVKPETRIQDVVNLMSQNKIGCVPVCDEKNHICGIVTDRDILLRCVDCKKDTNTTPVSDIMTCNVCSCKENEDITNAETIMGQNQIRRIPVCNTQNQLVGILTLGDLVQNDKKIGKQEMCNTLENICDCGKNQNNN